MKELGRNAGNILATCLTALQIDLNGIENIISIVCLSLTIVSIIFTLVINICNWAKKAKADGKIDSEDVKELAETAKESADDLNAVLSEFNKGEK